MIRPHIQCVLLVALVQSSPLVATQIRWDSDFGSTNLASDNSPMDSGFQFELGVFEGDFVPTADNKGQWAENWRPAQRVDYNPTTKAFDGTFEVANNDPPFTFGKAAYVWGWRVDATGAEWILFRATSWIWPESDTSPPVFLDWNAADATPVIGEINSSGVPFLMKSEAVSDAASPATTWEQWRAKALAGEPLDSPDDDPDQDGTPNLLEFVFGTDPKVAGPPPQTPVEVVTLGEDRFLQITVPRRIDHLATLVVEVSSDLETWNSGPAHTQTVADDAEALVVRDLTPLSPTAPARFMRLQASLP